jgi:thiamine biosynthesis lipoprotein
MPRRCRPLLGTFVEITADDMDAIDCAFAAVERVHRLMSAHVPDSDVSRINRLAHLEPIKVHDWTAVVIERALFWSRLSRGAFDVVGAGKVALETGLIPRQPMQASPEAARWTWLEIEGSFVRLLKPGCIDLGGIAKGFAVDRAVDALRQAGCEGGLVNAGGDIRAFGADSWSVEIAHPSTRLPMAEVSLHNNAIATSAGLPGHNGRLTFEHLPKGNPHWISVSVLARTACDADALTKIVWKDGSAAAALLEQVHASALAITCDGQVEAIAAPDLVPA